MQSIRSRALGTAAIASTLRSFAVVPQCRRRAIDSLLPAGCQARFMSSVSSPAPNSAPEQPSNDGARKDESHQDEVDAETKAAPDERAREAEDVEAASNTFSRRIRLGRSNGMRGRLASRRLADLPPFALPETFLESNLRLQEGRSRKNFMARTPFEAMDCPEAIQMWQNLLELAANRSSIIVQDASRGGNEPSRWKLRQFSSMEDDERFSADFSRERSNFRPTWVPLYMDLFTVVLDRWALDDTVTLATASQEALLDRCAIISLSATLALRGWAVDSSCRDPHRGLVGDWAQTLSSRVLETLQGVTATGQAILGERQISKRSPDWFLPELNTDPLMTETLYNDIRVDLAMKPPALPASPNGFTRPINIITVTNYAGKRLSNLLVRRFAQECGADVVRVDATDLGHLIGAYLGQDWAYSKGPMSMLGFRTAELDNKLESPISWPRRHENDDAEESNIFQIFGANEDSLAYKDDSNLMDELAKIRNNPKEYVLKSTDKWGSLKIDKALETIVSAANREDDHRAPLILHIDDFVQLGMTVEGALLIARLRKIVDDLWLDGHKIVVVGTSSVDKLQPRHIDAMADLALDNSVTIIEADGGVKTPWSKAMEQLDLLQTNLINAHVMWASISDQVPPLTRMLEGVVQVRQEILRFHNATSFFPPGKGSRCKGSSQWGMILPRLQEILDVWGGFTGPLTKGVVGPAHLLWWVKRFAGRFSMSHLNFFMSNGFSVRDAKIRSTNRALSDMGKSSSSTSSSSGGAGAIGSSSSSSTSSANQSRASTQKKAEKLEERLGVSNDHERKLLSGLVDKDSIKTTFADVHALPETIEALKLLTSLSLRRPDAFSYGVLSRDRIPGCLLYGPPGTGKTLLAKAVAKECGASMLEVSAASINDMWVGQGEKNVQAIFSLARKLAPQPLVVFIDEADALLASRGDAGRQRSHREVINQFLREWDGMADSTAFVMVATNRPFDLDDAVLRRLPRKLLIDLPAEPDRRAILGILLRDEQLAPDVDLDAIARDTPLYSGSDLKNVCVAAAMAAVREEVEEVDRRAREGGAAAEAEQERDQEQQQLQDEEADELTTRESLYEELERRASSPSGREEQKEEKDNKKTKGVLPSPYPEKRLLTTRHFELAKREIGASISDDMKSMREIRKFDETYGKPGRKKGRVLGFGVAGEIQTEARVRKVEKEEEGREKGSGSA